MSNPLMKYLQKSEQLSMLELNPHENIEIKSGEKVQQDPMCQFIALAAQLKNIKYCPISVLGKNEKGGLIFNAKLSGAIEDVTEYTDLLECLANMQPQDEIHIAIDSPGGYIHSGVVICTNILLCKGTVYTNAVGLCASAGSLIWSAGKICTVEPTAVLMWHMSSHEDMGNSLTIEQMAKIQVNFVKNVLLAASMRKGHITEQELETICTEPNAAIYISAEEMQKRLDSFQGVN